MDSSDYGKSRCYEVRKLKVIGLESSKVKYQISGRFESLSNRGRESSKVKECIIFDKGSLPFPSHVEYTYVINLRNHLLAIHV